MSPSDGDLAARTHGHGGVLFNWPIEHARSLGCAQLHLDRGIQRFAAHRLYLHKRMNIVAQHFSPTLRDHVDS